MTIGQIVAITALVCAAIGMTTQAEAANATGSIKLRGCAYIDLLCGTVMKDFAGNIYALNPPVPPYTPILMRGHKTGNVLCWGYGTEVRVDRYACDSSGRCTYR